MMRKSVGFVSIGRSIFPVIMAENDPLIEKLKQKNKPLILSELAEGLLLCYVRETESDLELVTEAHLGPYMMNREDIIKAAKRNLTERVRESAKIRTVNPADLSPGDKPFYRGILDKKFDTSLLVVDEFWERAAEMLNSKEIAVSIPARNAMYFSDLEVAESLNHMRSVGIEQYEESKKENQQLSENFYVRRDGTWILMTL